MSFDYTALRRMVDSANGKDVQEARHTDPVRKTLGDDLFRLAANAYILGPANEAEECIIAEVQSMCTRLASLMGYPSVGAFLADLRERAK